MSMFEELDLEKEKLEEKFPIVQMLHKIREWDVAWKEFYNNGKKPMNFTDFIESLNAEFEVKRRS